MATVLVVDDEPSIVDFLTELVTDAGHMAISANNGHDALILARQHQPLLIITDVMMPVMDGHTLLDALRTDPLLADTIVILMSASRTTAHTPLDATTLFVPKPLEIEMIETFLHTLPE